MLGHNLSVSITLGMGEGKFFYPPFLHPNTIVMLANNVTRG